MDPLWRKGQVLSLPLRQYRQKIGRIPLQRLGDEQAQYVFIGDYSGAITVCHLEAQGLKFINTLKGHSGSVRTLAWDGTRNWLYSGSFDCSVFVWDIGGRRGTVYELHGHRSKVTALVYGAEHRRLVSAGEDSRLVCWDM